MIFRDAQIHKLFHNGRCLSLRFDPLAVWKVKQFYRNVRTPAAKMQGGPEGIRKKVALWPSPMEFLGIPSPVWFVQVSGSKLMCIRLSSWMITQRKKMMGYNGITLDFEPRTLPVMHTHLYTSRQWVTPRINSVSFDRFLGPSFANPGHPCVAGFATSSGQSFMGSKSGQTWRVKCQT
jgi:hypothetical protein